MKLDTKENWWKAVDNNWNSINLLFFSKRGAQISDVPVADFVERAQKTNALSFLRAFEGEDGTLSEVMERYRSNRDPRLWWVFQSMWEGAPDSPKIHSWIFWGSFCDLCSEGMGLIVG